MPQSESDFGHESLRIAEADSMSEWLDIARQVVVDEEGLSHEETMSKLHAIDEAQEMAKAIDPLRELIESFDSYSRSFGNGEITFQVEYLRLAVEIAKS